MVENINENTEIEAIHRLLDAVCQDQPGLADACAYYHRLLPLLKNAQSGVCSTTMDSRRAQPKIDQGEPVFWGEELPFFPAQVVPLFFQILNAVAVKGKPVHSHMEGPEMVTHDQELAVVSLLHATLNRDREPLERAAQMLGLDVTISQIIAHNCLKPFLHVWQKSLAPRIDVSLWQKGNCPFCGNLPILAELRGPQRARYLRCGLCGADWPFGRLQCAFCGNLEPQSLGILQLEQDPEVVSIQHCTICHAYLRMLVTLEPIAADLLPVVDLSMVSLDIIARKYGFFQPG